MGVRFVHTADLHLGSPLETAGASAPDLREELRGATYEAFERVIDLTLEENADFLVIAGDLYDQKNRSVRANEFLATQLGRLDDASIPAYVIYGNHDPMGAAQQYIELPSNVHEFDHSEPEAIEYPSSDAPEARIWGQSYQRAREKRPLHKGYTPDDPSIPNIALLHTGLDPDSQKYVPCSRTDLHGNELINYWALGHIHQTRIHLGARPIVFPGIPQGRHIGEAGVGGCVLVDIQDTGDPTLEFVPTGRIVWRAVDVSIEGDAETTVETIDDLHESVEVVANGLEENMRDLESALGIPVRGDGWEPKGFVCRWYLTGRGPVNEILTANDEVLDSLRTRLRESLHHRDPFIWTDDVEDRTGPPLPDIEDLRGEDQVIDEFYDLMAELDDDKEARESLRAQLKPDISRSVWEEVDDPEEVSDDKLALTDEVLDDLIGRAEQLVIDELVRRRVS